MRNSGNAGFQPANHLKICRIEGGDPWYSRGYLPHVDQHGLVQSITFRLHDSLPARVIKEWKEELNFKENISTHDPKMVELRERMEKYEDAGHGACYLHQDSIAQLMENALLNFDGRRYNLIAWSVMPNHVHVLIETKEEFPISKVIHSWKSYTAKEANRLLNRTGVFWMREYYDRYIRNEIHLQAVIDYIEHNPVHAGLVKKPDQWKFGSKRYREIKEMPAGSRRSQ